jgi:hypothetical protein
MAIYSGKGSLAIDMKFGPKEWYGIHKYGQDGRHSANNIAAVVIIRKGRAVTEAEQVQYICPNFQWKCTVP